MEQLLGSYKITVHPTSDGCDAWIQEHIYNSNQFHVGLDTESRVFFGENEEQNGNTLAIIQIASGYSVLLFRVYDLERANMWPKNLVRLLEDDEVITYVVDARSEISDFSKLNINIKKLSDLQLMAQSSSSSASMFKVQPRVSAASLALTLLNIKLDKSKSIRTSNWSRPVLTVKQTVYAACDAVVSLELARKLNPDIPRNSNISSSSSSSSSSATSSTALVRPFNFKDTKQTLLLKAFCNEPEGTHSLSQLLSQSNYRYIYVGVTEVPYILRDDSRFHDVVTLSEDKLSVTRLKPILQNSAKK